MAYFLFIDESGQDHRESPYEVLAGVAVRDRDMGRLSASMHAAEHRHFGRRYTRGVNELKAKHLIKRKVFQHAGLNRAVPDEERTFLAKSALDDGASAGVAELKALGLAKLAFVEEAFRICGICRCRAFASVVEPDAPRTSTEGLRKDYAYLFERFFYFLEDQGGEQGIIVFDELDKSRSHILVDQMTDYFQRTRVGKTRAALIVPEPFFVHSHLATGVQFADLVAYVMSWGHRWPALTRPCRPELATFARQVAGLRYTSTRTVSGQVRDIHSFAHIADLRTNLERLSLADVGGA